MIPIESFLSSWYWYEKEHQTRYESFFGTKTYRSTRRMISWITRQLTRQSFRITPMRPMCFFGMVTGATCGRWSNKVRSGFGQLRITGLLWAMLHGMTRNLTNISTCLESNATARRTARKSRLSVTFGRTVSLPNYLVLCMSCDWDKRLFCDFSADFCVVIRDTNRSRNGSKLLRKWNSTGGTFTIILWDYFDPYDMSRNQALDASRSKDFRFAYQREYRFIWFHTGGLEASVFKY